MIFILICICIWIWIGQQFRNCLEFFKRQRKFLNIICSSTILYMLYTLMVLILSKSNFIIISALIFVIEHQLYILPFLKNSLKSLFQLLQPFAAVCNIFYSKIAHPSIPQTNLTNKSNPTNIQTKLIQPLQTQFQNSTLYNNIMQQAPKIEPTSYKITLTQHQPHRKPPHEPGYIEILSQGASFWSIPQNLQTIYDNFNILSYFSPAAGIQLRDRKIFRYFGDIIPGYLFQINNIPTQCCIFQTHRDSYQAHNPKKQLTITYHLTNNKNLPTLYIWPQIDQQIKLRQDQCRRIESMQQVRVQFRVIGREWEGEELVGGDIEIQVKDVNGWILENVYAGYYENRGKFGRISERLRSTRRWNYTDEELKKAYKNQYQKHVEKPAKFMLPKVSTDLEYFYLQPKTQRSKQIQKKHIVLALQGGGCKGVAYIGAYKAILDCYKNQDVQIKTIIGSSAGGIVGLAICCGISPEGIVELCEKYLSGVTQPSERTFKKPQQDKDMVNYYFTILESVCKMYNIFDDQLLQIIRNFLHDKQFVDQIQKWILYQTGFSQNTSLASLFRYTNGQINLCGLLNAKLMTGGKIKQLARSCLQKLNLKNRFYPNENFHLDDQRWQDKLTLKQLYQATSIQFTCTCLDLTNHILRFFNHKTTPNLPVVFAVKMTGAFPVAFEATYWRKQWGKYYVHYENVRREVDLEGCKFTDGGMLANFPVDCVDNQEMRAMYFSHCQAKEIREIQNILVDSQGKLMKPIKPLEDRSRIIYGVGLKQCKDPFIQPQKLRNTGNNTSLRQKIETVGKVLHNIGLGNIPSLFRQKLQSTFPLLQKLINPLQKSQETYKHAAQIDLLKQLRQIPLVDFVYNLLVTYTSTKDKLAQESFRHQVYEFVPSQPVQGYIKDREEAVEEVQNDIDKLRDKIEEMLEVREESEHIEALKSNLQYIRNHPPKNEQQLLKLRNKLDLILSNLMFNFIYFYTERDGTNVNFFELLDKVQEAYKKLKIKQVGMGEEKQVMLTQKIEEMIKFKACLDIGDQEAYEQILKSREKLKNYYLNRIFFQLELMKNCRLFVFSHINNDYQTIKRISEEAQKILDQVFKDKFKQTHKIPNLDQHKQFFVPQQYLQDQHKLEMKNLIKIKEALTYPIDFPQIKQALDQHTKMLEQLLEYNQKRHYFSFSPYNRLNLLSLIQLIQNYSKFNHEEQDLKEYFISLRALSQNLGNNETVKSVMKILAKIRTKLNQNLINKVFNKQGFLDNLLNLQTNIMTYKIQDLQQINQIISEFRSCIDLIIAYESYSNRQSMTAYFKKSIEPCLDKKEQIDGLHIVVESSPLSQIYLLDALEMIKYYRVQMAAQRESDLDSPLSKKESVRKNSLPITSITISNIHSIAAVSYVLDRIRSIKIFIFETKLQFNSQLLKHLQLDAEKMRKYVSQIKNLTYQNESSFIQRIQRKLQSGEWAKKLPTFLKDLTTLYTQQAQDRNIFTQTQQKLQSTTQWKQFKKQMKNVEGNAEYYKERLSQLIQQSLNCVMDEVYKSDQETVPIGVKLETIARNLTLSYKKIDYRQEQACGSLIEFVNILAQKYVELFKIAVESSQYVAEELVTNISRGEKKDAWKGLFLGQIHTSCKIKRIVQDIMQEVGLSKNTTLQQFYQASSKKITINFSVIATKSQCIEIYNHVTRPYMPVWAAVVATSSLMQFFKPLGDRKQWAYRLESDIEQRRIKRYLAELGPSSHHLYSADSLRRLPVDLLKNDKISKKINPSKSREIYLIFDFNLNINYAKTLKQSQYKNHNQNLIKISNINAKDIMKLLSLKVEAENILTIPLVEKAFKQVQSYVDSHDQLIMDLYRKQLILLPIRLGVVDFHKMCVQVVGEDKKMRPVLGEKSNDSVMQSYFVMKEKIMNLRAIQSQDRQNSKRLYFRLESVKNTKQVYENNKLIIRFLSKLVPNKDYRQNYKLYYQKDDSSFQKIQTQYLLLENRQKLTLKIQYVEIGSLKLCSRTFTLHLGTLLMTGQFGFVYCLEYSVLKDEQFLEPQGYLSASYKDDYMLSPQNKKRNDLDLRIKATLKWSTQQFKYQKPMCKKYHPIQVSQIQAPVTFFQSIEQTKQITKFICNTCHNDNQYKLSQKYQIKLCEGNKIKCTLDHPIEVKSRMGDYPLKFSFVECDRCCKNTPRSYFRDEGCKVELCFDCVFGMIRNQL